MRKRLLDDGFDAGAATIHYHLSQRLPSVPSVSTIWRVLKARGFVTPHPHKRPKSSFTRFVADLPNECWQADMTHVTLENGEVFEVLNVIDDHSRLCVASRAMVRVKAKDVVRVLHTSADTWGYPAAFLSDNGLIFTAQQRFGLAGSVEQELFALGITAKHSRPYHPQTCGKVERFHQTVKKFLAAQDGVATKKQMQRELDRFVDLLQRGAASPRHRTKDTGLRLCRPGEGRTHRRRRQDRRAPSSLRQGGQDRLRHAALPQSPAPHRDRCRLQGMAYRHADRRPQH